MKKNYVLSVIAVLLIVGIGFTFAYFMSGVNVSGDGSDVTVTPGNSMIEVEYDAGNTPLTGSNLIPGDSSSKEFTVTATPSEVEKDVTYAIYLDITNNTFVKCDDSNYNSITNACTINAQELTYTIRDTNSNTILASGDLTGVTGRVKLLTEMKTVDTQTEYNYTITITFAETNGDQNHNQNKTFTGNIVVEFSEYTLVDTVNEAYNNNPTMFAYDSTVDNNLRYIGSDPNNYVYFNCDDYQNPSSDTCELWRIIGVMNNIETTNGTTESLVKLIRNDSIGDYAWDDGDTNDWSVSSLQESLNGSYLQGTTFGNGKGITEETRNMIETITWKLGGSSTYNDVTASMFYERERGTTVFSGRPTEWSGKVGLMYASDYGYATSGGGSTTNRENCLANGLDSWSNCHFYDWLFESFQWTLTSYSSTSYNVFIINNIGRLFNSSSNSTFGVRPSIYLKSNIAITGGNGDINSPYTLEV